MPVDETPEQTQPPEETPPKVALVIAAHPDDPDFGVGGTAALWSRDGWQFHYLVVTNGAKGTADREMPRERLIALREPEQRAAAETLGVLSCTFLGWEDGELEYHRDVLGMIVREIRRLRPHAVFTHSPEVLQFPTESTRTPDTPEFMGFVNHRDHRMAGTMAIDAVYPTARDHLNFPEQLDAGLETHNVAELFVFGSNDPNFRVDITDIVELKIKALLQHTSQFADREKEFFDFVRARWKDEDGRFYERFRRLQFPF